MTPLGNTGNFNPLSINYPYDCNEYIHKLPAYDTSTGVDELLDLWRIIQQSGNYYWQGESFPDLKVAPTVAPQATVSGTITVPPGTYVTAVSAIALKEVNGTWEQGAGFNLKIYDKGSKANIFYGDYAYSKSVAGELFAVAQDSPKGPSLLLSPFIITGPGVIGWDITNLDVTASMIQVLLECAIPISARSILNMVIEKGY